MPTIPLSRLAVPRSSPGPPAASASPPRARFASMGLKVCLADLSAEALDRAVRSGRRRVGRGRDAVLTVATDVSQLRVGSGAAARPCMRHSAKSAC